MLIFLRHFNLTKFYIILKELNIMLKIYDLSKKPKYIEEISILTQKEWGEKNLHEKEFNSRIKQKI